MLYLMRKTGQSVVINNTIEVKIVEVKNKNARLGFDFPPECSVLRKEIHDHIIEENVLALKSLDALVKHTALAPSNQEEAEAAYA